MMLNRLLSSLTIECKTVQLPIHNTLMSKLETNENKLIEFNKQKPYTLSSNNQLNTLIQITPKSKTISSYDTLNNRLEEFYNNINSLNFTTVNNYSNAITNGIFNTRVNEHWLAVKDSFSNIYYRTDITPIRCIYHPFTSLNYWIAEEDGNSSDSYAFFLIDIRALILSVNDYYKNIEDFSIRDYIQKRIYPDVIKDMVAITSFNRLNSLYLSEIIPSEAIRKKPLWLDIADDLNKYYLDILNVIERENEGVNFISKNSYLTKKESIFTFLQGLPKVFTIGNVNAIYTIAILPYINFILDLNITSRNSIIDYALNRFIKTRISIIENDKSLNHKLPQLLEWRSLYFENLKTILK